MPSSKPADRPAPRSAYIHVPFCARRCGYCNFTLVAGRDDLIEPYLEALARELGWLERPRQVDTLYLGGGTPTHLKGPDLRRLLALVLEWHPLSAGHEFTVESNPGDVDEPAVAMLAEHGVTRVSLGAQSFAPDKLLALDRDHSAADIRRTVELIRAHGMAVSIDLIFAAPGETLAGWTSDLDDTIALAPAHVSAYELTFERGTEFWGRLRKREMASADEELARAMYETAIDRLAAAGLQQYEVSNFARPGSRCRHNEACWLGEEYYAAGPGAARYVGGVRSINHRSTTTYLKRVLTAMSPVAESEQLPPRERAMELLVFALRRREGIERGWFKAKAGISVDSLMREKLGEFVERELLSDDGRRIRLTHAGLLVSDALFGRLIRSEAVTG